MWVRNIDTGKWSNQTDSLSGDYYESLKVDLERVKLYSKCLSGATYLTLNNFDDLYPQLNQTKIGFYHGVLSQFNGPSIKITEENSEEFYEKYLKEDAFTLKTLFTPEKLLNDQYGNFKYVDVATDEIILFQSNSRIIIDGVQLKPGHRVLVKDQISTVTLDVDVNTEEYFTNTLVVSTYSNFTNEGVSNTYQYFNTQNGIYRYDGLNLVREDDLSSYENAYKLSVSVKLGETNKDKQFHLERLKNGYFPIQGQNIEFRERTNWILRNRVDYNNIFDLNYYDIKYFSSQTIYDQINSITYSIPERVIAVGEFGVIINNQDKFSESGTFSISNIMSNKYKVNLRSISQVDNYYWICGDEGVLLRVSKFDFSYEQITLNEDLNFTSVDFYGDLYGMVVGKFNTIYYTRDGGYNWTKIQLNEFNRFSYNKVVHLSANEVYIGGENGVFMELVYSNENWIGYKRNVRKELSKIDTYQLVENINDMYPTKFVNIKSFTYSKFTNSQSILENSIVYTTRVNRNNQLEIGIKSELFDRKFFQEGLVNLWISCSFSYSDGSSYENSQYGISVNQFDMNNPIDLTPYSGFNKLVATFSLPIDDFGNIQKGTNVLNFDIKHNYNYSDPYTPLETLTQSYLSFNAIANEGQIILMAANNETILCFDKDNIIDNTGNNFVYLSFSQSFQDAKSISRRLGTNEIYLAGSKIYDFSIYDFSNTTAGTNFSQGQLTEKFDDVCNKLWLQNDKLYIVGNSSLIKFGDVNDSLNDLDPTFNDRIKSRFLILDYDIGSKLNFFDDNNQYRLPESITFTFSNLLLEGSTFSIGSYNGETSWIDYYLDAEKTFEYGTRIQQASVVKVSNQFSYDPYIVSFTSSKIGIQKNDFESSGLSLLPHFYNNANSEFISHGNYPDTFLTQNDILLHKNIAIIKSTYFTGDDINGSNADYLNLSDKTKVGDVLNFTSDVVDTNLVVNKILYYTSTTSDGIGIFTQSKPPTRVGFKRIDTYLYTYSNFNESIVNSLKKSTNDGKVVTITNLNKFKDGDQLVSKFNAHPLGTAYKLSKPSDGEFTFTGLVNEKTSYYNLQCQVNIDTNTFDFKYKESFLDFGFIPTYNIYTFLNKINPQIFTSNKKFQILPEYYSLRGAGQDSFTSSNIWLDSSKQNNFLKFGSNFFPEWRSFMINTFVDFKIYTQTQTYDFQQFLIVEKYLDTSDGGYYLKFNKKIDLPIGNYLYFLDIKSRNTLSQISTDLQFLNNIHRSNTTKTIIWKENNSGVARSFTNYESSIKTKFSTSNYLKAFVSDYDIKQNITAILYNDANFEVSLNVLNVDKEVYFDITQIIPSRPNGFSTDKMQFQMVGVSNEINEGDLVFVELDGVTNSSMLGYQTIVTKSGGLVTTSKDFDFTVPGLSVGKIKVIKKDPFFNFQPVDLFRTGSDKKSTRSVEVMQSNVKLDGYRYSITSVDTNKFKIEMLDGLSLDELAMNYHWILEAEVSNAVIGKQNGELIWYSGTWRCGRWFGGRWISGKWLNGDWYKGNWEAFNVRKNLLSATIDNSFTDRNLSVWYNGRWFSGDWSNGTWYNGRRYAGNWKDGIWINGIWNDGKWKNGNFTGGIWVDGEWEAGTFNCDSNPAYWLYGSFKSGDFENGIWYNGFFGNEIGTRARFGTKANNSRTSIWHGGKWIDGEFHSFLKTDSLGDPTVSDIHKYSVWYTGQWIKGNWYGGIAYNIDFKGGIWHGGILEEIQVIGIDSILPSETSNNKIYVNGIFKFNPGDEIWLIDDDRNTVYSKLGNNEQPIKYRINKIEEDELNKKTGLFLNYNLSTLGISTIYASTTQSNLDLGVRVVSYFKDVQWKSGLWTNGIFDGNKFDSGIWYNGVFEGNWGI